MTGEDMWGGGWMEDVWDGCCVGSLVKDWVIQGEGGVAQEEEEK